MVDEFRESVALLEHAITGGGGCERRIEAALARLQSCNMAGVSPNDAYAPLVALLNADEPDYDSDVPCRISTSLAHRRFINAVSCARVFTQFLLLTNARVTEVPPALVAGAARPLVALTERLVVDDSAMHALDDMVFALRVLAYASDHHAAMQQAGVVPLLVRLMRLVGDADDDASEQIRLDASMALTELARHADCVDDVLACGAVPALVNMLAPARPPPRPKQPGQSRLSWEERALSREATESAYAAADALVALADASSAARVAAVTAGAVPALTALVAAANGPSHVVDKHTEDVDALGELATRKNRGAIAALRHLATLERETYARIEAALIALTRIEDR
jgi:hypothetical protein